MGSSRSVYAFNTAKHDNQHGLRDHRHVDITVFALTNRDLIII